MESTSDQPAEDRLSCGFGIGVKWLRIELGGEFDNFTGADHFDPGLEAIANLEVFEVALGHRSD